MKKVFSKEKYIEDMKKKAIKCSWINDCDGKTVEECNELGYLILDEWCEEVEDEN